MHLVQKHVTMYIFPCFVFLISSPDELSELSHRDMMLLFMQVVVVLLIPTHFHDFVQVLTRFGLNVVFLVLVLFLSWSGYTQF